MGFSELKKQLEGIIAITITPFNPDNDTVDYEALRANVRFLRDSGLKVLVPLGNTSEFSSVTPEERKNILEVVSEEVGKDVTLIAGVGGDVKSAILLGQIAQAVGAQGVMVHQPTGPYLMEKGLIDYYSQIAKSLDIAVIPYIRSKAVTVNVIETITKQHDNIIAVKYGMTDVQHLAELIESVSTEIVWVCGMAEMWAPFFYRAGAKGFTSGLVNVVPEFSFQMLEALNEDNSAKILEIYRKIKPFELLRAKNNNGNNVSVVKAAMRLIGLKPGTVRPPISEISEADYAELKAILAKWNKLPV